jgi:tetratricopeptide (TPR) repeat protein
LRRDIGFTARIGLLTGLRERELIYIKAKTLCDNGYGDDDSIVFFDKALAINPNFTDALTNKGVSLANLGKYNEAISVYDKALAINPNDTEVLKQKQAALEALSRK